jgi:hypothetical protein
MNELLSVIAVLVIGLAIGYGATKALTAFDWLLEKWYGE